MKWERYTVTPNDGRPLQDVIVPAGRPAWELVSKHHNRLDISTALVDSGDGELPTDALNLTGEK